MTASSVDFFPCRVKLLGLPPSSSGLAAANASSSPPIAKIHSISRNLFGAPDPGDMKALYQQEAERIRSYVLQRYNFDTKELRPVSYQESTDQTRISQATIVPQMQPTQLPSLIENELRQHEQCSNGEKRRISGAFSESTKTGEKTPIHENSCFQISRRCNESSEFLPAVNDRRRQPLLKDSFKIRKNRLCKKNSSQYCNDETTALENSKSSHRNFEILQLSQPLNWQQRRCVTLDKGNELPTCNDFICQQHADIKESRNRTISYDDNCTKLSLQLVVSTQNVS